MAQKKSKPQFTRREVKLADNHGWHDTPGYKICVMGRGDIRFEYPEAWVVVPTESSLKIHDKPYPNDNMVLEVSVLKMPPVDWSRAPSLEQLISDNMQKQGVLLMPSQVHRMEIPGLQLVWAERDDVDKDTGEPVVWRQAHCIPGGHYVGPGLVGVITFGFWKRIYEEGDANFNHIVSTIVMGEKIADPSVGPARPN